MVLEPGTIVEGKVTGITQFGAFISMKDGKTGLVHISEIAPEYVKNIHDHLKENDVVKVKVLSVDANGKISLSIKQAVLDERAKARKARSQSPKRPDDIEWPKKSQPASFEDMMAKFKQDSDEKLSVMKKGLDAKRGSSGYRRSSGSF